MSRADFGNGDVPHSLESCRFVTTAVGTAVYSGNGKYIGLYETDAAAVEMIRQMISKYSDGGSSDEI